MPREPHTFYLVKTLPLVCAACAAKWVDWTPTFADRDSIVAHLHARRCPSCASGPGELYPQENTYVDVLPLNRKTEEPTDG